MWSHCNRSTLSFEEGGKKCPSESQRGQQQESVRFWGVRPFFDLVSVITSLSPSPRVPTLAMLSAAGSNAQPAQKEKLRSAKSFFNVTPWDAAILCTTQKMDLPMSVSWLCCRASPRLCSCSELFQGQLHMFCLLEVRQIQSRHLPLGQGFLNAVKIRVFDKNHHKITVKIFGRSTNADL